MSAYHIELTHIVDFYFLDAMEAASAMHDAQLEAVHTNSKAMEKWQDDVREAKADIAAQLALSIRDYLFVAGVGEARHAEGRCDKWLDEIPSALTRSVACSKALKFSPTKGLPVLVNLFKQVWHGGAYGGPKWADCMEAGTHYGEWPDSMLVDHAVDLEHNGGTVFDKSSSASLVGMALKFQWPNQQMKTFLDVKRIYDLLTHNPTSSYKPHPYCMTATTFSLWCRWWYIFQHKEPPSWMKKFKEFIPWPDYDKNHPTFGEQEFTERTKHYVQKAQEIEALQYGTPRAYAVYGEHQPREERSTIEPPAHFSEPNIPKPKHPVHTDDEVEGVPQRKYAHLPA